MRYIIMLLLSASFTGAAQAEEMVCRVIETYKTLGRPPPAPATRCESAKKGACGDYFAGLCWVSGEDRVHFDRACTWVRKSDCSAVPAE